MIGSLGCSKEVLDLISCTNKLRKSKSWLDAYGGTAPFCYPQLAPRLRDRLRHATQEVHLIPESEFEVPDFDCIKNTAEFYRIATCLYLEQVTKDHADGGEYVQDLIKDCFTLLREMEVCTSPWPLFILACHSTTDDQRICILRTLEVMINRRGIGNVRVMHNLIQAVWRQEDIAGVNSYQNPTSVDWRELIASGSPMPSFV